jgi:hypothetical protein
MVRWPSRSSARVSPPSRVLTCWLICAGLEAVGLGAVAVHLDLDLRDGHLGLQVDVGEAGNG